MAGTEYSGDESETDIRKRMYANHENHPPAPLWSLEGVFCFLSCQTPRRNRLLYGVWRGFLCGTMVFCAKKRYVAREGLQS